MSGFTVEFAFELGQQVFFRDAPHDVDQTPRAFTVYERVAQECHGGVQRLYKLMVGEGRSELYPEILLCAEMPPLQPLSDAKIEERHRIEAARRARWEKFGWARYGGSP